MRLSDSQEVINALEESGVDVVCFGHRHKSAIWKNRIRVPHVLAAGGLFAQGCDTARQITIEGGAVAATDVFISGC